MKKSTFFLLGILFTLSNLDAQDMFEPIYELSAPRPIITNVNSITSYTYSALNFDENRQADTIILVGQDSVKLFLQSKIIESYPSPGKTISTEFDHSGTKKYTNTLIQDKDGRMVENIIKFDDQNTAQYLNSTKYYEYENDKLTKVIENGTEIIAIEHDKESLPTSMKLNAGFIFMSLERVKTKTGFRFDASMVPPEDKGEEEGLLGMMAEAMGDMPKTYIICEKKKEHQHFTYIEEDKKTGEKVSEETFVRNKDGKIIESIESKNADSHKKYKYTDSGKILEIEDLTKDTLFVNKLNDNEDYLIKHEELKYHEFEYDEQNMMIVERVFWNFDDKALTDYTIRKITYK